MFTKKASVDEKDLVEIERQDLEEKCGSCNGKLVSKIFWSKEGHHQKIECEECGMSVWRQLENK